MAKKYGSSIDLMQNELQNVRLQNLATHPSSPVLGQMYFNTSDNIIYIWNGTTWHDLRKVAGSGAITVSIVSGVVTVSIVPATGSVPGSMSAADKTKLDNATANATPSTLVMRDGSGNASFGQIIANKITGLATPTGISDAATKDYVDTLLYTGTKYKASVKVATTANITLSGTQTIDGISVAVGNRVLVKNQTTGSQNGPYIVAASAWTRATDLPVGASAASMQVWVEQGATQADTGWVCTNDTSTDVVGTDALTYTQFSGAGGLTTDATIIKTGNQLSVANYTVVAGSTVARKVVLTGTIGSGSASIFTHNLNTTSYSVNIYDQTTNEEYECDLILNANSVAITANGSALSVRVVVIG